MSSQNIVDKILADADVEAAGIVADAEKRAASVVETARANAEQDWDAARKETAEKSASVREKKQAAARLECAKISLAEKRRVIDEIYKAALEKLVSLSKEETIAFIDLLLNRYAEEGDEIVFAENFLYADGVKILPVVKSKKLVVAEKRLPLDGGMRLCGKASDKDLSYGAILAADRDENQSALAVELFD